jgi:hypothetical protein
MATMIVAAPVPAPPVPSADPAAVLVRGCDGYPAGTTGRVTGRHQGCLVFTPDVAQGVARWARPRSSLLVPPSLVLALD